MFLLIRTDKPEAQLHLFNKFKKIDSYTWHAHRKLSETLLSEIDTLLRANNLKKSDLSGIVVYKGPGSFTGLRIGVTVANTLAYSLVVPVTGSSGDNWIEEGIEQLNTHRSDQIVIPKYGSDANITQPRK